MRWLISLFVTVTTFSTVASAQSPSERENQQDSRFEAITGFNEVVKRVLVENQARLTAITEVNQATKKVLFEHHKQLEALRNGTILSEKDSKTIADLNDRIEKLSRTTEDIISTIKSLQTSNSKRSLNEDAVRSLVEEALVAQEAKLAKLKTGVTKVTGELDQFKTFTRMIGRRRNAAGGAVFVGEASVELEETLDDGKRIPLKHQTVSVFMQFKDDTPIKKATISTDANGIAKFTEPRLNGQPGPQYLLFRYDGDSTHRSCEHRFHVK